MKEYSLSVVLQARNRSGLARKIKRSKIPRICPSEWLDQARYA